MINGRDSTCMHCTYVDKLKRNYGAIHDCLESRHFFYGICIWCLLSCLMSHRSNVVLIAETGITAQGMGAVVAALKKSHCIEVLDVSGMYCMYAYIPV